MPSFAKHPHVTLHAALKPAFPLDARRLRVLAALVLAMIQARSVVLCTLKNHVQLPGTRAIRYQRLLRFVQFTVPEGLFTQFVLSVLPPGELWLILDRTNWKLGEQDINILLLSATWKSVSFPLLWTLLPHGGASSQQDRILLLKRFLLYCGDRKVAGVLADREFLGKTWFAFLEAKGIAPCIRLRRDVRVNGIPVWACFCQLEVGELRVWHRRMNVQGTYLRVLATRNAAGEILYLAYRGWPRKNLVRYAGRWGAETLHAAMKTRGFNLEDTGLTQAARVSTLLLVTSLAFVWTCLTGALHAASHGIKLKRHGHRAMSLFRQGLDHLQDLLVHPSEASWRTLADLMPLLQGASASEVTAYTSSVQSNDG